MKPDGGFIQEALENGTVSPSAAERMRAELGDRSGHFLPPPDGLRVDEDDEPNVARKSGCSYCHQVLEPAAAHWGRFSEQGSAWLDPSRFPVDQPACRLRGLEPLLETACERHYLSEREPIGRLRAYEFAFDGTELGEQVGRNADAGPPALVSRTT